MFSMAIGISRPVTFRNFSKRLLELEPELTEIIKESVQNLEIKFKKKFFKSIRSTVVEELNKNNLGPQGQLVKALGSNKSSPFSKEHLNFELNMLKAQNVSKSAAIESLERFKFAQEICNVYKDNEAEKKMNNYVELYKEYIKTL